MTSMRCFCYDTAGVQAMYMTPELRHGLYSVDPRDIGADEYESCEASDRDNEKAR